MAKVDNFRHWCQKVLPLVYDDSLSYYELLCKMVVYLNDTIDAVNENTDNVASMRTELTEFENNIQGQINTFKSDVNTEVNRFEGVVNSRVAELESFMNNYFDNLDVQNEINNKLDAMAVDGTLTNIMKPYIDTMTAGFDTRLTDATRSANLANERISEIANLPSGSTSGDAEVIDIRVGANGITYQSAGDAVRGQFLQNYNVLNEVAEFITEPVSTNTTTYWEYNIEAGKTYRLTNNTSSVIASTTRNSISGENIDTVGDIASGQFVDFTAEHNANYLRVYATQGGSFTFESMDKRLPVLEKEVHDISSVTDISATSDTTVYSTMNLKAGETIIITNNTSGVINLRTRNSTVGQNVETIGELSAGDTLIFTVGIDAVLLGFYSSSNGTVEVKRGLSGDVAKIQTEIDALDSELSLSGTGNESSYFNLNLKAGEIITIVNTTTGIINARTRNVIDGANVETIGNIGVGETVIHTITADAVYLGFYYSNTGDVTVKRGKIEELSTQIDRKFTIGSGELYTTLRAGIAEAIKYPHSYVFVKNGTYDLCTEFAEEISGSAEYKYGIKLENDVHVVFSSGAYVKAEYDGSDANVTRYFNPFYTGNGGYTIENLNIVAKNTRYCIHDENGGNTGIRTVKILNSQFYFDNTTAPVNYYPQCIGGGNGEHDYIEIVGCYFKSKIAESVATQIVSYHQDGTSSNAQSNVSVRDCYFADLGTFRATFYGTTELVSKAYLCGNTFGSAPYTQQEISGGSAPENYQLIEWNNIVR